MRRYKEGTAKSGRGGKGGKVKSRKQAIDPANGTTRIMTCLPRCLPSLP
jgi:hypothetical protein